MVAIKEFDAFSLDATHMIARWFDMDLLKTTGKITDAMHLYEKFAI